LRSLHLYLTTVNFSYLILAVRRVSLEEKTPGIPLLHYETAFLFFLTILETNINNIPPYPGTE
jgi:hypothetical protein